MYINRIRPTFSPRVAQLATQKRRSARELRPTIKRTREHSRKQRKRRLIKYLQSELAVSTTHGLPYIVNQDIHLCERNSWKLFFFGTLVLVVYLLAVQLTRYIETPIVMSVEMDYFNWNVSYPAFTLCPVIKVDNEAYNDMINETYIRTGQSLDKYLWAITSTSFEDLEPADVDLPANILSLIDPKNYASIAAAIFKKFDSSSVTTNTNWPISVEQVMTEVGMCHVVNSNIAAFDNPVNWYKGNVTKYSKNNIELSVHDRDFFTQIANYDDIYNVYIHDPDEMIVSTTSSYTHSLKGFLSLGVQIFISSITEGLRSASIRLRKCRFNDEPISERYPIYSYNRCMIECRIQMILKICGCIPHFYKPLLTERTCNLIELKCVIKHKREIIRLSTADSASKKLRHIKGLPKTSHDCGCVSQCESVVYQKDHEHFIPQTDFNRLRIGISNFPKVKVVREIIFSGYEILLKIGGAVNLCIGSSFISMVELFVTLIKILFYRIQSTVSQYSIEVFKFTAHKQE